MSITVFGASGFVGQNFTKYLKSVGVADIVEYDSKWKEYAGLYKEYPQVETVYNFAGYNGGIEFQGTQDIFVKNCKLNQEILDFTVNEIKPRKVVNIIASCAYRNKFDYLYEQEFLEDQPHPSVLQHGLAKRHLFLLSKYYSNEQISCISVCVPTLFGEADKFTEQSKLIGAITKKLSDGRKDFLGSGEEERQFLYIGDFCKIICILAKQYNDSHEIINVPSPHNYLVKDIITKIAKLVGHTGQVSFTGKLGGVRRKILMSGKFSYYCPDFAYENFDTSLEKTVRWFKENCIA